MNTLNICSVKKDENVAKNGVNDASSEEWMLENERTAHRCESVKVSRNN